MSEYGVYLVTGRRAYRGHQPGEQFEARINQAAEARAVARRDISLISRFTPSIQPGAFTFPEGWLQHEGGK